MKLGFEKVGIAREAESPENPMAMEERVVQVPEDVGRLVKAGCEVFVEKDAGKWLGYTNADYERAGAKIQTQEKIYRDKDLMLKLKGPSLKDIELLKPGSAFMCMAHLRSFPERKDAFERLRINVIAMEQILESPKEMSDELILSKVAMARLLVPFKPTKRELHVQFLGWSPRVVGAIRRAANRFPKSLTIFHHSVEKSQLTHFGEKSIYVFDSKSFTDKRQLIPFLRERRAIHFDLYEFDRNHGAEAIQNYREKHPPFEFGGRRIQCLNEAGMAGARYGLKLLTEESGKVLDPKNASVVVLGYGNVAMGAIEECHSQGVRRIQLLHAENTVQGKIESYLQEADLVINGAEQSEELRGKNFLVTRNHTRTVLDAGSVVIDLVGGSRVNRSAIENVEECTFLTDPFFVEDDVYFSALWGWPMMGFMKESGLKYSHQINDVLLRKEKVIRGLKKPAPGVARALAVGPFF